MNLKFLFVIACLLIGQLTNAQDNWKKSSKTADQLFATGNYEEAADYYLKAYQQKNTKLELLEKAGLCYDKIRSYPKAADVYNALSQHSDYPKARLQYARSLKQMGNHNEAISVFKSFLVNYKGDDKSDFVKVIKNEISGCELALANDSSDQKWTVEHLSENVNTIADEVAPLPFSEEIVYFSSTMEGFSKIYRSQYQSGEWNKAVVPNFPKFNNQHACHGSFTPDFTRFYFTLCNTQEFDPVNGECDIYVTVRENGDWSTPRKLRDYVKLDGKTATHPFVMHDGEMEILYFASDRKGGEGGMDIWFMTRHINSPEYDFTLPKNVGTTINTSGDEISPYYDNENDLMYFSSNGHPSFGGFDIFRSMGSMSKFSTPQNMMKPINSTADDYYFVENPKKSAGFFVSNRKYGNEKVSTEHDDIFFFSIPEEEIFASGNIYNKSNNSIVHDAQVVLYEVKGSGSRRLLQSIIANNGAYQFSLIPERHFEIEVNKDGFNSAKIKFNTIAFDSNKEYGKAVYLEQENMLSKVEEPVFTESTSTASVDTEYTPVKSTPTSTIDDDPIIVEDFEFAEPITLDDPVVTTPTTTNTTTDISLSNDGSSYINSYFEETIPVTTSAPKLDGTYYKVQIFMDGYFDENSNKWDEVRHLGTFQTELITEKKWTRILISEFYSLSEAKQVMETAREAGFFEAFVVKYVNGKRKN